MAIAERSATTVWEGNLAHGKALSTVPAERFGPGRHLGVTHRALERTDQPGGVDRRGPCLVFLDGALQRTGQGGNDPEQLEVTAKVTLDQKDGAPTVTTSELTVTGRVPGIDQSAFAQAAETAAQNCPISRALAGVEISVDATLAS